MIPIFLASDENYAKYMAVTICSIIANTKETLSFYILDGGISNTNKNKIKSLLDSSEHKLEFIKIDLSLFSNFPILQHFSINTYFRYLIPSLKPEIKKALYIDTDMVIQGDIAQLYHSDLNGKGIGAVAYLTENFNTLNSYKQKIGISQKHRYFNAGLLLIDCEFWRKNNIVATLFQKTALLQDKIQMADQDILNFVFENNYHELPPQYNIVIDITSDYFDFQDYISNINGCMILHYTGGRGMRPWVKKDCLGESYFWKYAVETPFYNELRTDLIINQLNTLIKKTEVQNAPHFTKVNLFNFIPIATIKTRKNKKRFSLFGIPLISIRKKSNT